MRSARTKAAFAATLSLTLVTTAVGLAQVHRATKVSFSIAKNHTDGKPERFTYSARGVVRGSKIVLQRQKGRGWKTLKTLRKHSGTSSVTQSTGEYVLRVAVIKSGRATSSKLRTVFVYGQIPFTALCDAPNVSWQNDRRGCSSSTEPVGPFLFESAATFDAPGSSSDSPPQPNLTINHATSCRLLHLDYGESNADQQRGGGSTQFTQTVIQEHTDPKSVTFPGGALQHSDFTLDGGPVQITDQSNFTGSGSLSVLENGFLTCYTPNGLVPAGG